MIEVTCVSIEVRPGEIRSFKIRNVKITHDRKRALITRLSKYGKVYFIYKAL